MLAPDDPDVAAAAAEAREILMDLGALTLLRGLPAGPAPARGNEPGEAEPAPAGDRSPAAG
jgi:hypothetical protein